MKTKTTIWIIILFLCLLGILGLPNQISYFGVTWNIDKKMNEDNVKSEIVVQESILKYVFPQDLVSINNFSSRQKVFERESVANVDFIIENQLELNYNFTIIWIYNNKTYYGWYNESNESSKQFYAYYPAIYDGDWQTQIILEWSYQNKSYSKDDLARFIVYPPIQR